MALTTIPTFTPSGFLQMSTPPAPLPNATEGYLPPLYGNVANTLALPAGSSPATVLIQNLGPEAAVVLLTTAAATTTGTASAGSVTVTLTSGTDVAVGQAVVGPGMNQGTFVAAISGTTLTISQPTTEAITTGSGSLNFIVPVTLPPASGQNAVLVPPMPAPPVALAYVASGFISAVCLNPGSRSVLAVSVGQ